MSNNWFLRAVLALASAAGILIASAASLTSADTAQTIEGIRKKHDLPALAVVVVKDGRICDRAAVGVRRWGELTPVTTNDLFHIGSCTKAMTATLTAMLIQEGKLHWDTTITNVFPELAGRIDKQYEPVTVEELLTHRGGVPGKPPPAAWAQAWRQKGTPVEQRYEFIMAVLKNPPEVAPGTKMIYSNQGYSIIGAMLEKLTGTPWEALITERLFKPLHMDSAGFGPPGTRGGLDQPWGHTRQESKLVPLQEDNPPAIGPGGRVHCTLDDLARFMMLHLRSSQINGLLKPDTLTRLHTPPEGGNYACGWLVVKRDWAGLRRAEGASAGDAGRAPTAPQAGGNALTHNGSNTMWFVVMWLAPERDFAVAVGTNVAGSGAEKGCDEAAAAMIHVWLAN
jgi:CubicO group peptidase (beta-lactamase class C family)